MKTKKQKQLPSAVETFMSIRKTWDIKPITHVKGNAKKENSKKTCRGKIILT